ncbi:GspE/PulE/PilB domain-containing protein [Geomonas edaphica]|uniref:GspE/PulE/PilB domain-containing protein n=1 Tax=Geomonas edaphica TaxID=2570226 RepID=UPI0010A920A2|nr:general secretion pathway protein [Geomonas edaphica]
MRLGEMLVQAGKITPFQLEETLKGQAIFGGRFGTNLVEMGYLDERDLAEFLSQKTGVPHATPEQLLDIPDEVIKLISYDYVKKYRVVPIELNKRKLTLAMVDPTDFNAIDEISFATGLIIMPVIAPELRIVTAMEKYYRIKREVRYISVEGGSRSRNRHHTSHQPVPQTAIPANRVAAAPPPPAPPKPTLELWPAHEEDEILDLPVLEDLSCLELLEQSEVQQADLALQPATQAPAAAAPGAAIPPAAPESAAAPTPAAEPATPHTTPEPPAAEIYEEVEDPEQDYSLESVLAGLAEPDDRDWIAELVTGHLGSQFRRVAFFLLRGGRASGWVARVDNRPVPEFEELELSLTEPSVLNVVDQSKNYFMGPMPATAGNQAIMEALGGGTPFNNLLVPLVMMGRVVAVLYVGGGSTPLEEKLPEIQKLIGKAAMAFEILILKSKIMMT